MFQASLFGDVEPQVDVSFAGISRRQLDEGSWMDVCRGWLAGADAVYAALLDVVAWRQRTVTMYQRRLPEPRLTSWWTEADGDEPLGVLAEARQALARQYHRHFDTIGFNLYRHGNDSVAWHGDLRGPPMPEADIAIVSVGGRRPFRLRPRNGGSSITYDVGHGDLLVMGGSCQHRWQHCVPKVRAAEPRLSITFRHSGVS